MKHSMNYFAYRNDKLVTWGDLKHVAEFLKVKEESIKWHATKSAKSRVNDHNSLIIFSEKELGI